MWTKIGLRASCLLPPRTRRKRVLSIPAEYRVNPFDVSPSGDLYFADKRNLDRIDKAMSDESVSLSKEEEEELFSL